jgi:hypothetical protein
MSEGPGGGRQLSPETVFDSDVENVCRIVTSSPGPRGRLPVTEKDGLTGLCPPTRDYVRRAKTRAEGLGVAAPMTLTGSSASSKADCAR